MTARTDFTELTSPFRGELALSPAGITRIVIFLEPAWFGRFAG